MQLPGQISFGSVASNQDFKRSNSTEVWRRVRKHWAIPIRLVDGELRFKGDASAPIDHSELVTPVEKLQSRKEIVTK
jgi:hypothetical protein